MAFVSSEIVSSVQLGLGSWPLGDNYNYLASSLEILIKAAGKWK
jgi:hypothetical protein